MTKRLRMISLIFAFGLASVAACSTDKGATPAGDAGMTITDDAAAPGEAGASDAGGVDADPGLTTDGPDLTAPTVLDLDDLTTNPTPYDWFDFRPNVKKLILEGVAESKHVAILWYTIADGGVGLHYHSKTESVYVINGTQTDAKGVYPTGTVYFNPPGSGHEIMHSSGFFILAYAAPPDFASTDLITEYTPLRIDTTVPDLTSLFPFEEGKPGVSIYTAPLDDMGGLGATFIAITAAADYLYRGNYLLVLRGSCDIDGVTLAKNKLVVGKTVEPRPYKVAASSTDSSCLALGVSF